MIAVTGANGQLGLLVIKSLLQKTAASNIIALIRDLDKADELKALGVQVRQADYNHVETLAPALQGVDKLLLISGSEVGQRVPQHQAVIDAAKNTGVKLFAYTSILKADTSPLKLAAEHKATEAAIQAAGLPAVILRNGWYSENYTQSLAGVVQAGAVVGAAQEGQLHTAARADYAEAAAVILTSTENQVGKIYELAGEQGFSLADYANEITKQTGKVIPYQALSEQEFSQVLTSIGLPAGFADLLADAEAQAAKGWLAEESGTLSQLIGRSTTPIAESIQHAL